MVFRFASRPVSLRDKFRPAPAPATDPHAETRAAQSLNGQRGRLAPRGAPQASGQFARVLRPLLPKGTVGLSQLQRRWAEFVGEPFCSFCQPTKLKGGVLTLSAPSARTPVLTHNEDLIIKKLRVSAGIELTAIKLEHRSTPLPTRPSNVRRLNQPLTEAEETTLSRTLGPVDDPDLKSALMRLGRALKQG